MKTENVKQLKIKLKDSDSDNFKSAIKKLCEDSKHISFKKGIYTEDEIKVIQQLSDKING